MTNSSFPNPSLAHQTCGCWVQNYWYKLWQKKADLLHPKHIFWLQLIYKMGMTDLIKKTNKNSYTNIYIPLFWLWHGIILCQCWSSNVFTHEAQFPSLKMFSFHYYPKANIALGFKWGLSLFCCSFSCYFRGKYLITTFQIMLSA